MIAIFLFSADFQKITAYWGARAYPAKVGDQCGDAPGPSTVKTPEIWRSIFTTSRLA
jgi:hypothetical protein